MSKSRSGAATEAKSEKLADLTYEEASSRGWGYLHTIYTMLKNANASEEATELGNRSTIRALIESAMENYK
jgi:hypothetical protein